jgi:hypothetical protein
MIGTGGSIRKGSADALADSLVRLVPEVDGVVWPTEPRASCGACPLLHDPRERFSPETRCCTYHPRLWNWQVGRALRRDDAGAALLRARIAAGGGVDATGVAPPAGWRERYFSPHMGFGRDVSMRCPYWVGGAESCGIWRDRNATCRTWFCRHEEGFVGRDAWLALRDALDAAEHDLAAAAIDAGEAPWPWAPIERFEAWYAWCAAWVDGLDEAALRAAVSPKVAGFRVVIATRVAARDRALPKRLACQSHRVAPRPGGAALSADSSWDPVEVGAADVGLATAFSDGEDVAAVLATWGDDRSALVRRLWRAGVLGAE